MKVTITIKGEEALEERTIIVHSLSDLDEIERLINLAITKEATDKGWAMDTRPSVYIHDEMGQMNFSKEETKDLWGKIVKKKLNNGD